MLLDVIVLIMTKVRINNNCNKCSDYQDCKGDIRSVFNSIFESFSEKININSIENIKNSLFEILKDRWEKCISTKYNSSIKYLNIFNTKNVEFYAEQIHTAGVLVTSDRKKIQKGDGAHAFSNNANTIGNVFRKNKIFDEIYECQFLLEKKNKNSRKDFIDWLSYKNTNNSYDHCDELGLKLLEDRDLIKFNRWLSALERAYVKRDEIIPITHFFYIIGPVYFGSNDDVLKDFIVRANVGFKIEGKGYLPEIKIFLKALKIFINKLTYFLILKQKEKDVSYQATRAAISQVFVRNLAHNLISHTLIHLTNEKAFSAVGIYPLINREKAYKGYFNIASDSVPGSKKESVREVEEVKNDVSQNTQKYKEKLTCIIQGLNDSNLLASADSIFNLINNEVYTIENKTLYPNNQIASLFSYIANRCLYLNEATYGITNMLGNKRVYGELFMEFDENRILLNHISGIENFKYKIEFQHNGNKLSNDTDISVALPGDTLGAQAFFNIIENIVRNTAKHNGSAQDVITFTVNFDDLNSNNNIKFVEKEKFYCVEIWDDIPVNNKDESGNEIKEKIEEKDEVENKDHKKYFGAEADLNKELSKIDYLIFRQNTRMNNSVFDNKTHILRSDSLGLLEMEASAAFLRQIDLPEIESDYYSLKHNCHYNTFNDKDYPYFMQAFKKEVKKETEEFSLGYRFYMKRPEKYLIITDNESLNSNNKKNDWLNNGITIISQTDFKKSLEGDNPNCYNHEFALLVGEIDTENKTPVYDFFYNSREEKINSKSKSDRTPELSLLPERLMKVDQSFINELVTEVFIAEKLEKKIWRQWEGEIDDDCGKKIKRVYANYNDGNQKQIILFDHLTNEKLWKNEETNFENNKIIAVESLSSNAQQKLPNFHLRGSIGCYLKDLKRNAENNTTIILKLFEAYSNKVVVLDERIQGFSKEIYKENISNFRIFKCSNVIMPITKDNNKDNIHLDQKEYTYEMIAAIEGFVEDNIIDADFLLIHYGVLERMYEDPGISKKLVEWAKKTKVVITTGRGKHSLKQLPSCVSFINLSAVLYAFKDNRNKYSINYILNQSRR